MNDVELMKLALSEARSALGRGECGVGAVLVMGGRVIAQDGNREIELHDPTAHAEILVLRKAGQILGFHTFPESVVYTTLWPCPMCTNAMLRAKVPRVVCGARSFGYIYNETFSMRNIEISGPIMESECREVFVRWVRDTGRDFILKQLTTQPGQ